MELNAIDSIGLNGNEIAPAAAGAILCLLWGSVKKTAAGMTFFDGVNIVWIGYQTVSITAYAAIQPFLTANLFYVAGSLVLSGSLLFEMRDKQINKRATLINITTIISAVILSGNILYWEFYL